MSTQPQTDEKWNVQVQVRTSSGKGVARKLRAQGKVPGVLYGHNLPEATSLVLDPEKMYDLLTTRRRKNIVFRLEIDNGDTYENVMVKEYQIDPLQRNLVHADLVVIDPNVPVHVQVPVETVGRPIGVRQGGKLQIVRANVPVTCLPNDIPLVIERNVTKLAMGQSVLASQLKLPEGVYPDWSVDFAVCRIAIPRGATLVAGGDDEEDEEGEE